MPWHGRAILRPVLVALPLLLAMGGHGVTAQATPTVVTPAPTPSPSPGRAAGPPDGIIPPPSVPTRQNPLPPPGPALPDASTPPAATPAAAAPTARPPAPSGTNRPAAPPARRPAANGPGNTDRSVTPVEAPADATAPPAESPATPADAMAPPPPAEAVDADGTDGDAGSRWPEWLPLAALGAAALALLAAWLWSRRRSSSGATAPLDDPATETRPEKAAPTAPRARDTLPKADVKAESAPKAARPAAALAKTGRRAQLDISFEAVSAVSTLVNFRLRYAVHVRNAGPVDAADVSIRIGLFAGTQASEGGVARWLAMDGQAPHHHAAAVAANGDVRIEGELAAPLDALGAMEVGGRRLAIALVAVDCRYHNAADAPVLDGQAARAFVVGREPAADDGTAADAAIPAKLAPFRIDQGPMSYAPLGVRSTGIAINQ